MNNLGVVVGEACNGSQEVLGAWSLDSNGTWVVRNLGPSASSPSDINDAGEIAAPTALDGVQALLSASNGDYQRVQLQDAQFVGGINAHGVIAGSTIDGESAVWAVTRLKGFDPPVDGGGVLNSAKAGSTIPLKWRVVDTLGRPVTDLTNVALSLNPVSCAQFPKTDAIEEYEPSSSDLKNLGDGYYQLNWKTSKSLSRTCQRLDLEALKGGSLSAVFMFR